MIGILRHRQTSGTETPLIPGMIRITFDLDQFAILNVCQYPAATMAAGPGRPCSGAHDLAVSVFHLFCLHKPFLEKSSGEPSLKKETIVSPKGFGLHPSIRENRECGNEGKRKFQVLFASYRYA
jgi:hypothetical protein